MFVLSMMVKFHHHDSDGCMMIAVTSHHDIAIGLHIGHHDCEESHSHSTGDSDALRFCQLTPDTFVSSKQLNVTVDSFEPTPSPAISRPGTEISTVSLTTTQDKKHVNSQLDCWRFRGPPSRA